MKMQVFERMVGHPVIQIIPQGAEFLAFQATVEVRFFTWNNDGRAIYKPTVSPNVHFNELTPDSAKEWGNIFQAASLIANLDASVHLLAVGCDEQIIEIFAAVEKSHRELKQYTQTTPAIQVAP